MVIYHQVHCEVCGWYIGITQDKPSNPKCADCYNKMKRNHENQVNAGAPRVDLSKAFDVYCSECDDYLESTDETPVEAVCGKCAHLANGVRVIHVETLRKTFGTIDKQFYHELEHETSNESVEYTPEEQMGLFEMEMDLALSTEDFKWAEAIEVSMRILVHFTK